MKNSMAEVEDWIRSIELPEGVELLVSCMHLKMGTGGGLGNGYNLAWVPYLIAVRMESGKPRLFAHRIDLGSFFNMKANPEATQRLVENQAAAFKAKIDGGTATEVEDGGLLP